MDNNIGTVISIVRESQGVSQSALCKGLCSASTLNRIEQNLIYPDTTLIDYLFTRLGTSARQYINVFMNSEEFRNSEDRIKIIQLLRVGNVTEAEDLIADMDKRKQFKKKLDRQELETTKFALEAWKNKFEKSPRSNQSSHKKKGMANKPPKAA